MALSATSMRHAYGLSLQVVLKPPESRCATHLSARKGNLQAPRRPTRLASVHEGGLAGLGKGWDFRERWGFWEGRGQRFLERAVVRFP
jgi:hypothetical protein